MSTAASVLLALATVQLLWAVSGGFAARPLHRGRRSKFLGSLAIIGIPVIGGTTAWQIWHDGVLIATVPVYLVALLSSVTAIVVRGRRRRGRASRRRHLLLRIGLATLSLPLLAVPVIEAVIVPIDADDYRDESWSSAYDRLHGTLRSRYAFGHWKRIDWEELYARHAPAVVAAEQARDSDAYYRAVRAYLHDVPDGHIGIDGTANDGARNDEIGGGFGFAVLRLADGTVVAHVTEPRGPAAKAGMAWGAQIIGWDDTPVDEAILATSTLWASRPPATEQGVAIARLQMLTRAPVGAERLVTFRNPGDRHTHTALLVAYDDNYTSLDASILGGTPTNTTQQFEEPVHHRMLDGDIGHIRIASLETIDGRSPVDAVGQAMESMHGARGLILDVRGNRGGWDGHVPKMMSYFAPNRLLYEHIAVPAPIGDGVLRLLSLHVEPNEQQFTGPVVVLVDHRTKSSGEGFALIAKQLPNVQVIGLAATDGSFGMTGGRVLLPTGIEVVYPWALSVDSADMTQVDGDHQLLGGVEPDVVVPLTFEAAESIYRYGDDVTLDVASRWLRFANRPEVGSKPR